MTDTETSDRQALVGRTLGPYRILQEVGAGAVGTVYRAIHTGLDRQVALKVLRSEMLQDGDSVRRFLREARSSARLEHPNIVSVYDAGETDGQYYIAMKLVEGRTLQDLLRQSGRFSPERVVHLGTQLASALDYAHGRDVIHLDVKPANVIVTLHDDATLTDFSIAQALTPGATHSSTIAGTPLYMSPEQIQGQELDSRSDIYSLGLVLFEMCVGHPPFQGQFVTVMYAHLHTPVPDLRAASPQIPETLANVIYRALAKERGERYQTAGELMRALERTEFRAMRDGSGTMRLGREDVESLQAGIVPPSSKGAPVPRPAGSPALVPASDEKAETGSRAKAGRALVLVASLMGCLLLLALADIIRSRASNPGPPAPAAVPAAPPLSAQIRVTNARLSASYSQDPSTGQPVVGAPLTAISARELGKQTVYAVSEFGLSRRPRSGSISFRPRYVLHDPGGAQVDTFPPHAPRVVLDRGHGQTVFVSGFILQPTRKQSPPLGRYRVDLVVGGHVFSTLAFSLTR